MLFLDPVTADLVARLHQAGHEVYVVGGAVRDALLGRRAEDVDLATSARPDVLLDLFPDCDPVQVGKQFGVVLVRGVEIATFRTEAYGGQGRRDCQVAWAASIEEDLSRRDFTVNALAWSPVTGRLVDPFGGQADLARRVIRFVGDPAARLREDPVRALRACRFAARRGWYLDPASREAVKAQADLVLGLPGERVRLELIKALRLGRPSRFFQGLEETGLLARLAPEMVPLVGHPGGPYHGEDVWTHSLLVGDALPRRDPLLRLAGFLHDLGKPLVFDGLAFPGHAEAGARLAEALLGRWRFSREETRRVVGLVVWHMARPAQTPKGLRRFVHRLSLDGVAWRDWLRLRLADRRGNLAQPPDFRASLGLSRALAQAARELVPAVRLAVDGHDVMAVLRLPPGPEVGRVLRALRDLVLEEGPQCNNREFLLGWLARQRA